MNKVAIAAVVVLAAMPLALPGLVGSVTEAHVRERIAAIDASDGVSAELTAFERGWFRSSAKIALRLAPDHLPLLGALGDGAWLATEPIPIAVEFAHGPVAVLDGVHFGWRKMIARLDKETPGVAEFEATLGVLYLFEFRGRTGFGGELAFDADMPAFELPIDEALLTFAGATLEGTFAGRELTASAAAPSFDFTSPTGRFAVSNLSASIDNELHSQYVLPGEATLSIERVAITDAARAEPMFEAENLRVASTSALDDAGELLEVRVSYDLGSVRIENSELTTATLGATLRNLDVAALDAYGAAASDAASTAAGPRELIAALAPQLERALRAAPSLTIDPLRFSLDGEPFEGRMTVSANTARLPPAGALDLDNPLLVLGLVDTHAQVRLSMALARRLATLTAQAELGGDGSIPPEQLDYMAEAQSGLTLAFLVGQGLLVEDGDSYRTSLEFTGGTLTVNGNPWPLGMR